MGKVNEPMNNLVQDFKKFSPFRKWEYAEGMQHVTVGISHVLVQTLHASCFFLMSLDR